MNENTALTKTLYAHPNYVFLYKQILHDSGWSFPLNVYTLACCVSLLVVLWLPGPYRRAWMKSIADFCIEVLPELSFTRITVQLSCKLKQAVRSSPAPCARNYGVRVISETSEKMLWGWSFLRQLGLIRVCAMNQYFKTTDYTRASCCNAVYVMVSMWPKWFIFLSI